MLHEHFVAFCLFTRGISPKVFYLIVSVATCAIKDCVSTSCATRKLVSATKRAVIWPTIHSYPAFGPAWRTASEAWLAYLAKLDWKRPASRRA